MESDDMCPKCKRMFDRHTDLQLTVCATQFIRNNDVVE